MTSEEQSERRTLTNSDRFVFRSAQCCFDLTRCTVTFVAARSGIRLAQDTVGPSPRTPAAAVARGCPKQEMPGHNLIGLQFAIYLKSNLLRTIAATTPDEWPHHVAKFIARLGGSTLQDATALAVLLADLRGQIRAVANEIGEMASEAAVDERTLMTMSRDEVVEWFRAEMLAITLRAPRPIGARSRLVEDAVQFIHEHYAESVTTAVIAAALGQSKRHVVTIFRRQTGQTIHEYLTYVRLRHGLELLKQGYKIEAVSLMVGYRSRKNFYRHFKAFLGMTPHTYKLTFLRDL